MVHGRRNLTRLVMGAIVAGVLLGGQSLWASQAGSSHKKIRSQAAPGYLGVYLRDLDTQTAHQLRLKSVKGAEIVGVDRDAPAGKVGLEPQDVIIAVNGQQIENELQLQQILHAMPAGQTIHLRIVRRGKKKEVTVKLASRAQVEAEAWPEGAIFADELPNMQMASGFMSIPFAHNLGANVYLREFAMVGCYGMDVEPIGKQLAAYFGAPHGGGLLVRRVAPHSDAAAAGLQAGDVIAAANGMPSGTLRGWLMVISQNQGKAVTLKVIRNHKVKMIQYTPGRHNKQQSRLTMPGSHMGIPGGISPMQGIAVWGSGYESQWTAPVSR